MENESDFKAADIEYSIPGYPEYELSINKENRVTTRNVTQFIRDVVDATIGKGVHKQLLSFQRGFSELISLDYLKGFYTEEIETVLCGERNEDWSKKSILEAIEADHGYSKSSRVIGDLVEMLSTFSNKDKREFLKFCTGSPKLPLGGFQALNPLLTIVRRVSKRPDECLPSVMTCAHYLKVPEYSSLAAMKEKFVIALSEGQSSFHLS